MASIAIVVYGNSVSALIVLTLAHFIKTYLMFKLCASTQIPHLGACMVETELSHRQVRHYVLRMYHPEVLSRGVKSHDVVCERLVSRARGPESIEIHLIQRRVQLLFFNVHCSESCEGCT